MIVAYHVGAGYQTWSFARAIPIFHGWASAQPIGKPISILSAVFCSVGSTAHLGIFKVFSLFKALYFSCVIQELTPMLESKRMQPVSYVSVPEEQSYIFSSFSFKEQSCLPKLTSINVISEAWQDGKLLVFLTTTLWWFGVLFQGTRGKFQKTKYTKPHQCVYFVNSQSWIKEQCSGSITEENVLS